MTSTINLAKIQQEIRNLFTTKVVSIIKEVRNSDMEQVIEKVDGDSATQADIEIGRLLALELPTLVPGSLVVEEESFDQKVFEQMQHHPYVWVVDPIDGTKAFRTKGNDQYCVAVALLEKGRPIYSGVYAPELKLRGEVGCLFEARDDQPGAYLNGQEVKLAEHKGRPTVRDQVKCINHIHRDYDLNQLETQLAKQFINQETIRAFDGHSTLVHYCLVATASQPRVFTRRQANLWDVVQSAYIVEKAGGVVMDQQGDSILPVDFAKLQFIPEGNKLIFPFNIACPTWLSEEIRQLMVRYK